MPAQILDGWIKGFLPGPGGREYEVEKEPRTDQSFVKLAAVQPNLCFHTTEAPDLGKRYESWPYPSQFGVGDHRIVQLFPTWAQGKAAKSSSGDSYGMAVEITGRSQTGVWLPEDHALHPLVALTAFLHSTKVVKTGLERPTDDWPTNVDKLPAAVSSYYRRKAGLWPNVAGVYGHIEMPYPDSHWDPGGFDYPTFFGMVRDVLGGDEDVSFSEYVAGFDAYRDKFKTNGEDPGGPPDGKPADWKVGWSHARFSASFPEPAPSHE